MSIKHFINLIPSNLRAKGIWTSCLSVVQAILNLAGITALIPIIILVLDPDKMNEYPMVASHQTLILISVVAFIALKNILNVWISSQRTQYINKLYAYYSHHLYNYYFNQGLLYLKDQHSDKLAYNTNAVSYLFTHGTLSLTFSMISEAVLLILIWIGIVWFSPLAAISIIICLIPFVTIYFYWFRKRLSIYGRKENEAKRDAMTVVGDTFRGYSDVKLNDAYKWFKDRLDLDISKIAYSRERINRTLMIPRGVIECYVIIGLILFVIIGGNNSDTRVMLGILAVATLRMLPSLSSLITMATQWKNNSFTIDIIGEIPKDENSEEINNTPIHFAEEIKIHNISYQYLNKESWIFEDFSLTIRKSECLGIQGVSGVGKTTLINLLLGFYSPQKGSVLVDTTEINYETRSMWQKIIAYVPQHIFIMDTTLAENIAFGKETPDIERIMKAIEQSGLTGCASNLPNGIDTRIGQNGSFLSGGEVQRVGIARALYKKADVFFFDEITSSLDINTEQELMNTIQLLCEESHITCIIISHKETTLSFCDRIIDISK